MRICSPPTLTTNSAAHLKGDPHATAPEKASLEGAARETIAGCMGANGIEGRGVLLAMDSLAIPPRTGARPHVPRTACRCDQARDYEPVALSRVPRLELGRQLVGRQARGRGGRRTHRRKAAYATALDKATTTGTWSPVLDAVSDRVLAPAVQAEQRFRAILLRVAPGKLSAMTGPYRAPGVLPPFTRNADEVDLHYQAEQIQPPESRFAQRRLPQAARQARVGTPRALWNDDGTN